MSGMSLNNFPHPDKAQILTALAAICDPNDVVELRSFAKGKRRTDAGYFDAQHWDALAEEAVRLNVAGAAVYVTLNQLDRQLLGRYHNRVENYAAETATDSNITRRRWLLLDFDPRRPKNTSATDAQVQAAKVRARGCYRALKDEGWPDPIVAESGNGVHLLYPVDLPNDNTSRDLIKGVLAGLASRFNDDIVELDQAVFNAARITKLYGTAATKGDHTGDTPWRLSRLVDTPARGSVVTVEQLKAVSPVVQQQIAVRADSGSGKYLDFDLAAFLGRLGIEYAQDTHEGAERYKLAHCPFNQDHGRGEAAIFQQPSGRLGFKCQHNGCADREWRDVRELVDGPRVTAQGAKTSVVGPSARQEPRTAISGDDTERAVTEVVLVRGDSVRPEGIRWYWPGHLAAGKLHILAGAPGTGKTTLALGLAATITTGGRWPDGERASGGDVLIWSGEDALADTLAPRLLAAGADMTRVHFVDTVREADESIPFDPAKHFPALALAASRLTNLRLMIVDPIVSAVAGDSHKNAEVRRGLQPLVEFAERIDCALIGVTHFTKFTQGKDPLERLTGSLGFGAVARVVLGTAQRKEEEGGGRVLVRVKNNLGPDGGGFVYEVRQVVLPGSASPIVASRVEWVSPIDGSAREILASAEAQPDAEERPELAEAADWLRARIEEAGGTMDRRDIMRDAKDAGFSERTIDRARTDLGITARSSGFGKEKRSLWQLIDNAGPISPTLGANGVPANPATIAPIPPNGLLGGHGGNGGGNGADVAQTESGEII